MTDRTDSRRTFVVPEVRGKMRPQFKVVGGRPYVYTHPETQMYEESVRRAYGRAWEGSPPLQGAIRMDLEIFRPRPLEHYRIIHKERSRYVKDTAPEYPIVTPDLSNIEKAIEDALNKIAYQDDRQIVEKHTISKYNSVRREAMVRVTLTPLEPQTEP